MLGVSTILWLPVYNSLVLTLLLLVQLYFMIAFMVLQRKQTEERRADAKKQLELARAQLHKEDVVGQN